ncbi:MAG TPA: DsbA family protein [Ferrovibrio sp.]|jgi:protein-disulfide isomerase|uniref:DsbA family protein n=1 Tax=Ferrovibrio sp. TaxID=1917215 RepID=UPI002B4B93D0|nr:DsbA family protein [Ferrovibrio sp.]HLT77399.1 DsbA family protein [Ferrovibrio sp.]
MSFRLLALLPFLACFALPAAAQQQPFTPEQKAAIERLVREVLVTNPEILIEAMQALEEKQEAQASQTARAAIAANRGELFNDSHSYVAGNPKGDVTIVEFFDYRCGYCKQVHPSLQALLKEDSKVRLVLKELPVLGPESLVASRAAVAALEQDKGGKYLAFHNAMMSHRGQFSEAEIFRMAREAGLNVTKLKADMTAPKVEQVLRANHELAGKLGIQGTPGFVIGEELVPGAIPLEAMRSLVKQARG